MDAHDSVSRAAHEPMIYERRSSFGRLFFLLIFLVLVVSLPYIVENVEYGYVRGQMRARAEIAAEELAKLGKTAELVTLSDTSRAFRLVAQRVEPSVVHIDTEQVAARPGVVSFDEYGNLGPGYYRAQGQGSGVIIDAAGYILTNYHVIQNANRVQVHLADGRTIDDVEIVGTDPLTDLAVLRVTAMGLIAAEWGDSEKLEAGDWVLAIGNPFGLDGSLTAGIVSAKQRRFGDRFSPYRNFLQTDAAVNPGNSGGPLVNIQGEVVGINTAIVGEAFQGISFAIPSEIARDVYQRLRETGQVTRGYLGVGLQELTDDLANRLGLADASIGALVGGVEQGGPAHKSGFQAGDVIVKWDGQPVESVETLRMRIAGTEVGKRVEAEVIRDRNPITLEVVVGKRPAHVDPR